MTTKIFRIEYDSTKMDRNGSPETTQQTAHILASTERGARAALKRKLLYHFDEVAIGKITMIPIAATVND